MKYIFRSRKDIQVIFLLRISDYSDWRIDTSYKSTSVRFLIFNSKYVLQSCLSLIMITERYNFLLLFVQYFSLHLYKMCHLAIRADNISSIVLFLFNENSSVVVGFKRDKQIQRYSNYYICLKINLTPDFKFTA